MKFLSSIPYIIAFFAINVVFAEEKKEIDSKAEYGKIDFTKANRFFRADPASTKPLLAKDLEGAVGDYIKTLSEHPAVKVVYQGATFVFQESAKLETSLKNIIKAIPGARETGKILKTVKMFGEFVKEELGESIKIPEDKEAKGSKSAVIGLTGEKDPKDPSKLSLADLAKMADELIEEVKVHEQKIEAHNKAAESNKNLKFDGYKMEDSRILTKMASGLVLNVLKLNCECEAYRILIARTISHIAVTCSTVIGINKKEAEKLSKTDKDTAGLLNKIKNVSNEVACTIRPLFSSIIFKVVLIATLFIFVVIGIVTVLVTRKVNEKEH